MSFIYVSNPKIDFKKAVKFFWPFTIREFLNNVFIVGDFGSGFEYMLAQLELTYDRMGSR